MASKWPFPDAVYSGHFAESCEQVSDMPKRAGSPVGGLTATPPGPGADHPATQQPHRWDHQGTALAVQWGKQAAPTAKAPKGLWWSELGRPTLQP